MAECPCVIVLFQFDDDVVLALIVMLLIPQSFNGPEDSEAHGSFKILASSVALFFRKLPLFKAASGVARWFASTTV